MRFLKTDTIQFLGDDEEWPKKYAILSHTWGKGEVLYTDIVNCTARGKPGYGKVESACVMAASDGYDCIWIDNCCIDKSSSAELTEAINSMFLWYKEADICYAYMLDMPPDITIQNPDFRDEMARAKWFTRGWTMQELVAPAELTFFASDWSVVGTKKELRSILSSITGIDEDVLEDSARLDLTSVAKRMSWAAGRETTRPEDLAYCLMGIFSVNMPMLYGEGSVKAFWRLQEEIMKQSDDQSIFAWTEKGSADSNQHGLLADSPSAFRNSKKIAPYQDWEPRKPYSMSNRGLAIELPLTKLRDDIWIAALDCPVPPTYADSSFLAIYLQKLPVGDQQFTRVQLGRFTQVRERGAMQTVYVRQVIHQQEEHKKIFPRHVFQLRTGPSLEQYMVVKIVCADYEESKSAPPSIASRAPALEWAKGRTTFSIARGAHQLTAAIIFEREECERLVVMLGSASDFEVGFDAASASEVEIDNRLGTFESLRSYFTPRDPGGVITLVDDNVKVSMNAVISGGYKYYMVDIELTPIVRPMSLIERIEERVFGGESLTERVGIYPRLVEPPEEEFEKNLLKKKRSRWNFIKLRKQDEED